jgi:hypothetical protein
MLCRAFMHTKGIGMVTMVTRKHIYLLDKAYIYHAD